jgi:hypothetical protein
MTGEETTAFKRRGRLLAVVLAVRHGALSLPPPPPVKATCAWAACGTAHDRPSPSEKKRYRTHREMILKNGSSRDISNSQCLIHVPPRRLSHQISADLDHALLLSSRGSFCDGSLRKYGNVYSQKKRSKAQEKKRFCEFKPNICSILQHRSSSVRPLNNGTPTPCSWQGVSQQSPLHAQHTHTSPPPAQRSSCHMQTPLAACSGTAFIQPRPGGYMQCTKHILHQIRLHGLAFQ